MSFAESLSGSQCWGLNLITALLSTLVSVAVEILVLKALQPGICDVISLHIVRPTDIAECSPCLAIREWIVQQEKETSEMCIKMHLIMVLREGKTSRPWGVG